MLALQIGQSYMFMPKDPRCNKKCVKGPYMVSSIDKDTFRVFGDVRWHQMNDYLIDKLGGLTHGNVAGAQDSHSLDQESGIANSNATAVEQGSEARV